MLHRDVPSSAVYWADLPGEKNPKLLCYINLRRTGAILKWKQNTDKKLFGTEQKENPIIMYNKRESYDGNYH